MFSHICSDLFFIIKDKMKAAALAKIAVGCSDFYQDAQKQLHRDSVKGLFEKVNHILLNFLKQIYFYLFN